MSTQSMWVSIVIVVAIALYSIVNALVNATTKIKQYDVEIEKMRKEGKNDTENDSQGS